MIRLQYYRREVYAEIDHIPVTMDLYVPECDQPVPVIVWFHEGGLVDRTRYVFGPPLMEMVTRGYAVAQPTYRIYADRELCSDPKSVQWPAMLQDARTAIRYLRSKASEYGLDPDRIGVAGDSAGGQLSAMIALTAGDPSFDTELYSEYSSRVNCAVDFYGPAEFLTMDEQAEQNPVRNPFLIHDNPDSPESLAIGGPIQENQDRARAASAVSYVSEQGDKSIPMLIFHGDRDMNVPFQQSETLYRKMKECGYNVRFFPQSGFGHDLGFFENVKATVFEFFDHYVKNAPDADS